jgi:hypothetical protein
MDSRGSGLPAGHPDGASTASGVAPESVFCGDGLHGRDDRNVGTDKEPRWQTVYCDKLYAEAVITLQHFIEMVGRGE